MELLGYCLRYTQDPFAKQMEKPLVDYPEFVKPCKNLPNVANMGNAADFSRDSAWKN
jgi:hypothetical protein